MSNYDYDDCGYCNKMSCDGCPLWKVSEEWHEYDPLDKKATDITPYDVYSPSELGLGYVK